MKAGLKRAMERAEACGIVLPTPRGKKLQEEDAASNSSSNNANEAGGEGSAGNGEQGDGGGVLDAVDTAKTMTVQEALKKAEIGATR
jgi:hypothetical protein